MKQNFGMRVYDDCIYIGELKITQRHGIGVLIYKTNRVYEGEWFNDYREGIGYEKYTNGNVYFG